MAERLIRSVLVPNRGEIAVRLARACREMGIRSVLARAEGDDEPFVSRAFDGCESLGGGRASETYLRVARIIDAARRAGVDAIHPGYGFLSERAEMAAATADAGIVFIGPPAEAIERMGSKAESRRLMAELGVPVIPGYDGADQSNETLVAEALRIGFPLLIKASAGGGGKGMKLVLAGKDLVAAIEAARRESAAAFGHDRLLVEKYIENPRHIEFQIFGDDEGRVVHLFERDCSVQRRHQKVIEESPAPWFSGELRTQMSESAVRAASGLGYVNAGTVEFIVSGNDHYFLEVNTRLQVEHPITEVVLGVDLVQAQIRVAGGAPLPWAQEDLVQRGHAIECRVYAEDPDQGFLPQAGTIEAYREPGGPGIRVDSGVEEGSVVSVSYDPLLAKLIAWSSSRATCIERLDRAIGEYVILGTTTNLSHLARVVRHERFRNGVYDTSFLDVCSDELLRVEAPETSAIAAVLSGMRVAPVRHGPTGDGAGIRSVWDQLGGIWR